MERPSARGVIEAIVDPGSFASWDDPIDIDVADSDYRLELERASERSGTDEAVLTGQALIGGHATALIVGEFSFLGGSIGQAAARRILEAIKRATRGSLPVLAVTASGGTRMQEGTPAFLGMVGIAAAIKRHRAAGLPYLAYLRHPTTGGVLASWGGSAQITFAEPGALIGFLGPRVTKLLSGVEIPEDVQTAENLAARGFIDAVISLDELRTAVASVLDALAPAHAEPPRPSAWSAAPNRGLDPWVAVQRTRQPDRVSVNDLERHGIERLASLVGTGQECGPFSASLARVLGRTCVLLAQDRRATRAIGPDHLRRACRAMDIAEEWRVPVVTIVDTAGAELSADAENGGLAFEIARCIATMSSLDVPSVALLLGEGTGGAALAFLGARRVIAAEHAWLAPLPLEGASAIVYRDVSRAPDLARRMQITSRDLMNLGFVSNIVEEPVHSSADELAESLVSALARALDDLRVAAVPDAAQSPRDS